MTWCEFLLLKKLSMGLSPLLKYNLFRTLKRLNGEEVMTILLVEQNAKLAMHFKTPQDYRINPGSEFLGQVKLVLEVTSLYRL